MVSIRFKCSTCSPTGKRKSVMYQAMTATRSLPDSTSSEMKGDITSSEMKGNQRHSIDGVIQQNYQNNWHFTFTDKWFSNRLSGGQKWNLYFLLLHPGPVLGAAGVLDGKIRLFPRMSFAFWLQRRRESVYSGTKLTFSLSISKVQTVQSPSEHTTLLY